MTLETGLTAKGWIWVQHEGKSIRISQGQAKELIKELKLLTLENYYVIKPEIARKLPIDADKCFMKYDVAEKVMFVGAKENSSNLVKTTFTKAEFKSIMMENKDNSLFREIFEVASPSW